jgi:peptide-methionine (S)-S-oxide reductase
MEIQDMQKQLKSLSILLKSVLRLLESFATHDPTTINRQGNDVGNTAVRYFITGAEKTAEDYIGLMTAEDTFGKQLKISPVSKFYEAEKVHQNYYNDNKSQGYCSYVITLK